MTIKVATSPLEKEFMDIKYSCNLIKRSGLYEIGK